MSEPFRDVDRLRTIADYQFGAGAGSELFPPGETLSIERSNTGRPRQVIADAGRLVSFTTEGRFTLGIEGGRRLHAALPGTYRVAVNEESEPHIREGKNAFAKFVREVDPQVRTGDEVCITSEAGNLLGVGRAALAADGMEEFETGMAVMTRERVGQESDA